MNSIIKIRLCLLLFLPFANAGADVVGQFTFDDRTTLANALKATSMSQGAMLSSLGFDTATPLDYAGLDNVPATDNDGYAFGSPPGALFLTRAATELIHSAWGGASTSAASAPLNFTISADAGHQITLTGLSITTGIYSAVTIYSFQEAGATKGPEITAAVNSTTSAPLNAPVVIAAGSSKTFTVRLNSGNFDSFHEFSSISLEGSVAALPTTSIGEFTFNTLTTLEKALQSSSVLSGATLSSLGFNTTTTLNFAGLNNVPNTVNDGYGFGNNGGQVVMFFHRAEINKASAWGGANTSAAAAPWHFTISADASHQITVTSISVTTTGSTPPAIYNFQEAGALVGPSITGTTTTVSLATPAVIPAGSSKTFTVNLDSGNYNTAHNFNSISINGTVASSTTYSNWSASHVGYQDPGLDFDGDGTPNGIEYFMGEKGSGFTAQPTPASGIVTWPRDSSAVIASFKVQISDTLATEGWTDIAPSDPNLNLSNPNEVKFTLPMGSSRKFCRLVVTP